MLIPTTTSLTRTVGFAEARREKAKPAALPIRVNTITGSLGEDESYSEDALFRHMNSALEVERKKVGQYQKDLEASGKKFEIMQESYKLILERQQQTLKFLQKELVAARIPKYSTNDVEAANYLTLLGMKSQAGPASPSTSYYNPIVPSLTSTPSSVDQTFASTSNISSLESPKVLSLSSYVEATSPRQQEFKKIEKSRKRLRNRFSSICSSPIRPSTDDEKSCRIKLWIAETQNDTRLYDSDPYRS